MTNEEILAESIDRAKKKGFETVHSGVGLVDFLHDVYMEYGVKGDYSFIFSHDFAKAFWGEEDLTVCHHDGLILEPEQIRYNETCDICGGDLWFPKCWQYHLQEMVLEEDPVRYLEKFL